MSAMNSREARKILIRSTNWLGDAVMTIPAMGVVRRAFPDAEITLLANPAVAELFKEHPSCDHVIVWDKKHLHKGAAGLLRFSSKLHRDNFNLAILFQNAIEAAIMVWLARIPRRVGYRTDGRGLLLNYGVPVSPRDRRLHHVAYYLHMLEKAGIVAEPGPLSLSCTPEEVAGARERLGEADWVAINPGAAYGSAKRWLPERFAQAANQIYMEFKTPILLLGSPNEASVGNQISGKMNVPHKNLIGTTSIRELMAALSLCRLLLTNDSGPMHIAAAFNIPIVALFGPTDHTTTSPAGNISKIIRHEVDCAPCLKRHCPTDHRCMTGISVDEVMESIRMLLDLSG